MDDDLEADDAPRESGSAVRRLPRFAKELVMDGKPVVFSAASENGLNAAIVDWLRWTSIKEHEGR